MRSSTFYTALWALVTVQRGLSLPVAQNLQPFPVPQIPSLESTSDVKSSSTPFEQGQPEAVKPGPIPPITQSKVKALEEKVHGFVQRAKETIKGVFHKDSDTNAQEASSDGEGPFVENPNLIGLSQGQGQGNEFLFHGPLLSIEVFPGEFGLRGIKLKNISGNETSYGTTSPSPIVKHPSRFIFDDRRESADLSCTPPMGATH
jgi:hypothetical protein